MLEQILQECKNWFFIPGKIKTGTFQIADRRLALPFLQDGQYFRIVGSVFNDGLHRYPDEHLVNETFCGSVWPLAIPQAVISLSEKVAAWEEKSGAAVAGPFASESFGGYSYSRATAKDGGTLTWKDVFAHELSQWRKI